MKPWDKTSWEEWKQHPEVRDRVETLRHLGWEESQVLDLLREIHRTCRSFTGSLRALDMRIAASLEKAGGDAQCRKGQSPHLSESSKTESS